MPLYPPASGGGGGGGIPEAPVNTSPYVRMGAAWLRTFISRAPDSGSFNHPDLGLTYAAGNGVPPNVHKFLPLVLYRDTTMAALAVRVTTLVASSNFQLAIYASTGVGGAPDGPPLVQTGPMSGATAAAVSAPVVTPALLPAGIYWACVIADTTGIVFLTLPASMGFASAYFGGSLSDITSTSAIHTYVYQLAGTYGVWPTISGTATKQFGTGTIQTAAVFWSAQ